MNNLINEMNFDKLCKVLQLGEPVNTPKPVTGGLIHRMYRVETTRGNYAVKVLNPQVMLRPAAKKQVIIAERIAGKAFLRIPAVPALKINGAVLQQIGSQFCVVFDWIEGKSLRPSEITRDHSAKIGSILARLHETDFSELGIHDDYSNKFGPIDWRNYLKEGITHHLEWHPLLHENLDQLIEWNRQAGEAAKRLGTEKVISHRDMDSKNVLWHRNSPVIIDWESAGYINPLQDLTETAVYWAKKEDGSIDKDKFLAFIRAYKKEHGPLHADWKMVLSGGLKAKLEWLEYNLKRSLRTECSDNLEQRLGTAQVTETIYDIIQYAERLDELESWLIQ